MADDAPLPPRMVTTDTPVGVLEVRAVVAMSGERRWDLASLALAVVGLLSGVTTYWLIAERGLTALLIVPPVIATTLGVTHIRNLVPRPDEMGARMTMNDVQRTQRQAVDKARRFVADVRALEREGVARDELVRLARCGKSWR